MVSTSVSLYVHIPFCQKKCDYCHFYVIPNKELYKEQLIDGLRLEWGRVKEMIVDKEIVTLYFGGGTPSLFGPERIGEVIRLVGGAQEITFEANPEDITLKLMQDYANVGVNRVSIGIQSLDNDLLKKLGRNHQAAKAIEAVEITSQAGIQNISVDLMYDLPRQTLSQWQRTLEGVCMLPITHLSLYNLTIEPHTVFFKHRDEIKKQLPDESVSGEMYALAQQTLEKACLKQYEISAFAKEGCQSKHNSGYWTGRPFLGLGPSAFSYWEGKRFRNVAHLNRYCQALKEGRSPVDFEERLDEDAQMRERFVIHLRLLAGVPKDAYPLSKETEKQIEKLEKEGFVDRQIDKIVLTQKGILFYDHIASELI